MNLDLLYWNGHPINDGVDYKTYILPESKFALAAQPVFADRAEHYPYLSGKAMTPQAFSFKITIVPDDLTAQDDLREQLKGWFDDQDFQPHALIAADKNDNDTQYQLVGFLQNGVPDTGEGSGFVTFLINIALADPAWQAVTATTDTWGITATGQQRKITIDGNTFVKPKFTIKPTAARTGQYPYSRWVPFYNRVPVPLPNYPIDITNGGLNTANLVNATAVSNQINVGGGINAAVTTIPIDTAVGGGLPITGGIAYIGTEQILYTANTGTSLTGVTRGYGGTTAASHADNAVIAMSKMLANGSDIAVMFDGNLINVWPDSPNTASTKIWIAQSWQPGQLGQLHTALPNNGTTVNVQLIGTTANLNLLKALKAARNNVFIIDNEAFTYSPANVDFIGAQIKNCQRAQKNTSFAAHSALASVIWVEHDIWLLYGNTSGSPFTTDDTQKPLLNLNTSTNTSWVQTQFYDTGSVRPAAWSPAVITSVGHQSVIFTGNQKALANPATELGMDLINYLQANLWKAETASISWHFYHPCGIVTVSIAGSKYLFTLTGSAWPAIAGLQKSLNGSTWLTVWTEAIPISANTWAAWTHNGQSLSGTYKNIRLALIGTIAAQPNNDAAFQGDTVTLALDSTLTPVVAVNAENSIYYFNATLTNTTTTDYMTIALQVTLNTSFVIDTAKKKVTGPDGANLIASITLSSVRNDWMPLHVGDNILQWDDPGTAGVEIDTSYNVRNR